ncbi:MAG TPA: hypothetical protein VNT79_08120, partial [Phycisphaerae bacterium]|nr:hypothetical protein [Phycisphaerae bacterium]
TIGRGAIVHANTELLRSVPPFSNFGGVPRGRHIGWRKPLRLSPKMSNENGAERGLNKISQSENQAGE